MVVTVIAVLAGLAVPALTGSGGRGVQRAAQELTGLINRARQEAALEARIWCLRLRPEARAYAFQRRVGGECRTVEGRLFRERHLSGAVAWEALRINGQPVREAGRVLLFPTGEQDTLEVVLERRDGGGRRTVRLGPVGRARLVSHD